MKYLDEYRNPDLVRKWADALHTITERPWTVMEVCGGQTHSIVKFGLQELLPDKIRLIHGPGCPVCVTPIHLIDHAIHIAAHKKTIVCSYGDMLRVPGTDTDLLTMKARGGDVRIVLSPMEAVEIARQNPHQEVVFFAVGFETTAPANAMAVHMAKERGVHNFSILASHVLVPPALKFLFQAPDNEIQGILAAGHVCTIMGESEYEELVAAHDIPIVITGFEPVDIMQGLYYCIRQLENNEATLQNQYRRSVQGQGNVVAQHVLKAVFKVVDQKWRGIGSIPLSGLALQEEFLNCDAAVRFPFKQPVCDEENGCLSGLVLQGKTKPCECPLFGKQCTPETPFGAPMVSNEGACAAYYHYGKGVS